MKTISVSEAKAFDLYTMRDVGIPSLVLMERAALKSVENLAQLNWDLTHILVVAGSGNNGGDGIAVARLLKIHGFNVQLLLVGNPEHASIERIQQLKFANHYGVEVIQGGIPDWNAYSVIIDAIFGIGLSRPVSGNYQQVIQNINDSTANTLAIDVPSGFSPETGRELGIAVHANATATFAYAKNGMDSTTGQAFCGQLFVDDIGIYDPQVIQNLQNK
ncbi:NAD(P)H-hydrate epimerase [Nicoliella spurrieriana]|uniref:NAD(P)H-hydrate epimerase n=1 Tax=Nicoliella spurrieriana TaxID=2925830 RepID=A0A976RR52_9LACO|nr:NAD(P)H-hydrate epimerase [Nicoliella spurrieriana]UQS86287.1 NAD(P)H-hydrate epimerase [Nicoliella spurrieriana]